MHGDQAQAADYDDPMCDRLLGIAATSSVRSVAPSAVDIWR